MQRLIRLMLTAVLASIAAIGLGAQAGHAYASTVKPGTYQADWKQLRECNGTPYCSPRTWTESASATLVLNSDRTFTCSGPDCVSGVAAGTWGDTDPVHSQYIALYAGGKSIAILRVGSLADGTPTLFGGKSWTAEKPLDVKVHFVLQ